MIISAKMNSGTLKMTLLNGPKKNLRNFMLSCIQKQMKMGCLLSIKGGDLNNNTAKYAFQ